MGTEMHKLRQDFKETEKQLLQSAQLGKDLLEENARLMMENGINSRKIENLEQDNYSLNNRLKASQKSEEALHEELEATRDQCSKDVNVQTEDLSRLTKRVKELERDLAEGDNERIELKASLGQLKIENESLMTADRKASKPAVIDIQSTVVLDAELWRQTEQEIQERKQKEELLMETIEANDEQLRDFKEMHSNLRNHIEELEDKLTDKESKLSEYFNAVDRYRDEIAELKIELQSADMRETDPDRRGNSLFSEVEDHRQRLEKHLNSLRKKYDTLHKENEINLSRISSLRLQIAGLIAASRGKVNASHVEHLEMKLAQVQSELKMRIHREEISAKHPPEFVASTGQLKSDNQSGFLQVLLRQAESKCEELEKENRSMQFKYMSESEQVRLVRHELRKAEQRAEEMFVENMRLKLKLEDIQRKSGENKENTTDKVIEKINTGRGTKDGTLLRPFCLSADPSEAESVPSGKEEPERSTKVSFLMAPENKLTVPPSVNKAGNKQINSSVAAELPTRQRVPVRVTRVTQNPDECTQQ